MPMSYLRKSCPTNGWSRRRKEDDVRRSYGGEGTPEWILEEKPCMSPAGVALMSSVDKVEWLLCDKEMSCLDILEKRMGATNAGLSRLHELLEYLTEKTSGWVTGDVASQSRQLCQRLIKNHMETYSALATLRSLSVDTPKHHQQPPPRSPATTILTTHDDGYDSTLEWLNASETGTVVHQEEEFPNPEVIDLKSMLAGFIESTEGGKAVDTAKGLLETLQGEDGGEERILTPRTSLRRNRKSNVSKVAEHSVTGALAAAASCVEEAELSMGNEMLLPHPPTVTGSPSPSLAVLTLAGAAAAVFSIENGESADDYPASQESSPLPSPIFKNKCRKRRPSIPLAVSAEIPSRPSRNRLKPLSDNPLSIVLSSAGRKQRVAGGTRSTSPSEG